MKKKFSFLQSIPRRCQEQESQSVAYGQISRIAGERGVVFHRGAHGLGSGRQHRNIRFFKRLALRIIGNRKKGAFGGLRCNGIGSSVPINRSRVRTGRMIYRQWLISKKNGRETANHHCKNKELHPAREYSCNCRKIFSCFRFHGHHRLKMQYKYNIILTKLFCFLIKKNEV